MCILSHMTHAGTRGIHVRDADAVRTMHLVLLAAVLIHASVARRHHHHHPHQISISTTEPEPVGGHLEKIVVIDSNTGIQYNPYSKHHPGRHVCTSHKNVTVPVKTKEAYCKPVYRKYVERCVSNQVCTGVRLVFETAYRDVLTTTTTSQVIYICCPGWGQVNNRSHGCNRPQCTTKCQNGGSCVRPDVCNCPKGFIGRYCEADINECKEQKPCDQICHNTIGSFKCECRENFALQSDGQSCRKEGEDGPAFEAKDLEYELLDKRLFKLETMLGNAQINTTLPPHGEMQKLTNNIETVSKDINLLKTKLKEIEKYKNDVSVMKNKLNQLEKKTNKVDEMWMKYDKMKTCIMANKICF